MSTVVFSVCGIVDLARKPRATDGSGQMLHAIGMMRICCHVYHHLHCVIRLRVLLCISMVLSVEYRIPMPLNKSEYEVGQLYGVARLSAKEGEEMAKKGASGEAGGGVSGCLCPPLLFCAPRQHERRAKASRHRWCFWRMRPTRTIQNMVR